jgi:hypothetical protein
MPATANRLDNAPIDASHILVGIFVFFCCDLAWVILGVLSQAHIGVLLFTTFLYSNLLLTMRTFHFSIINLVHMGGSGGSVRSLVAMALAWGYGKACGTEGYDLWFYEKEALFIVTSRPSVVL